MQMSAKCLQLLSSAGVGVWDKLCLLKREILELEISFLEVFFLVLCLFLQLYTPGFNFFPFFFSPMYSNEVDLLQTLCLFLKTCERGISAQVVFPI